MFERCTDSSRRVVVYSREEARKLNSENVGTAHLLLGLIHEEENVAAQILSELGISLEEVRRQVLEIVASRQYRYAHTSDGTPAFTPAARMVLEMSLREALSQDCTYIGTEHMLLGLIREDKGAGAQVLKKHLGGIDEARRQVMAVLARKPVTNAAESIPLNTDVKRLLDLAKQEALKSQDDQVRIEHLLAALAADKWPLSRKQP